MGCRSVWKWIVNQTSLQSYLCFIAVVGSLIKTWYSPANSISGNAEERDSFLHRSNPARKYLLLPVTLMPLISLYSTWLGFFLLVHWCQVPWLHTEVLLTALNRQERSPPKTPGKGLIAGVRGEEPAAIPCRQGNGLVLGNHNICSVLVEELLAVG